MNLFGKVDGKFNSRLFLDFFILFYFPFHSPTSRIAMGNNPTKSKFSVPRLSPEVKFFSLGGKLFFFTQSKGVFLLTEDRCKDEGATAFAEMLKTNSTLTTICLECK